MLSGRLAWLWLLTCLGCGRPAAERVEVLWMAEPRERGAIVATPRVDADDVYALTIQDLGFQSLGTLRKYSLQTGKQSWAFDDDNALRHGICRPLRMGQSVIVGEGMHANHFCHLYALDPQTGQLRWKVRAEGHIESSPIASGEDVVVGAGDDGVYCVRERDGTVRWHYRDAIHVDATPAVDGPSLYFGTGPSRAVRDSFAISLEAATGKVRWKVPLDLPAWGSPQVLEGTVFLGLGNGRLTRSSDDGQTPRGALLAIDANTGQRRWRVDLPDAVMARPAVERDFVWFTCRDGMAYCVSRMDGSPRWKQPLGSPVVTEPVRSGERLYVVSTRGRLVCLDARTGKLIWQWDLGEQTLATPVVFASPVVIESPGTGRRILLACELKGAAQSAAVLYCLQESTAP